MSQGLRPWISFGLSLVFVGMAAFLGSISCSSKHPVEPDPEAALFTTDSLIAEGTYRITTQVPVNALLIAPAQIADYLQLLIGLRDNPAKTFFSVLDAAGLKHVDDLYELLPGYLQDKVDDAINDYLNKKRRDDTAFARQEDELIANAEKAFTHFQVISDLTIQRDNFIDVRHRFRGLGYTFDVNGRSLPFQFIDSPLLALQTGILISDVAVRAQFQPTVAGKATPAKYQFSDHSFGLPFGRLFWQAIEAQHLEATGLSWREELGQQVNCDGMGASVANTCVSLVCIGNKARVRVLCEDALDQVLLQTQEKFTAMGFDALRFREGEATLARAISAEPDSSLGEKRATHMRFGNWNLDVNYGSSPRNVKATFSGALQPTE